MAVNTGNYLKSFFDQTTALGEKVISSDFTLVIEGFENIHLLCKQAPWPELSPMGEIEISTPLGSMMYQPQQVKTADQGQVSFYETTAGDIDQALVNLLTNNKCRFNAWIYEGTPEHFLRRKYIRSAFIQLDAPDRDWENRSQPLMFSGTMFYHYFGETEEGNSNDYE